MSAKTFFWVGLAFFVVAGIGYYNIRRDVAVSNTDNNDGVTIVGVEENKEDTNDSSSKPTVGNVEMEQAPIASVHVPSVSRENQPAPNLDQEIVFGPDVPEGEKETTRGQVKILTDTLKADPNLFNEWMDLGILLKSAGDYERARQVWEYAGAIRPENSLSFANLGTLYGYYLKNPIKAEANLLHAVENEPRFLDLYARMTDFYLEVMNDKEKALQFLERAIAQYPEGEDLKKLKEYIAKQRSSKV